MTKIELKAQHYPADQDRAWVEESLVNKAASLIKEIRDETIKIDAISDMESQEFEEALARIVPLGQQARTLYQKLGHGLAPKFSFRWELYRELEAAAIDAAEVEYDYRTRNVVRESRGYWG